MRVLYTSRMSRARGSLSTVTEKRELYRVWSSFFVLSVAFNLPVIAYPRVRYERILSFIRIRCVRPREGANLIHLDRYTVNQRLLLRSRGYWNGAGTKGRRRVDLRRWGAHSLTRAFSASLSFSLSSLHLVLSPAHPSFSRWRSTAVPSAYVDDYRDET